LKFSKIASPYQHALKFERGKWWYANKPNIMKWATTENVYIREMAFTHNVRIFFSTDEQFMYFKLRWE